MDDAIQDSTPFPAPERLGAIAAREPEVTGAWLHVVSGPTVPVLSRAVFELAARFLARGDRVLLLDGAPRLRLHERFDREARWGMLDSLAGPLPLLGLVQDAGRLGLYLLAYGTLEGLADWSRLATLLDEARPYFGRAVLALDPDAPAVIGHALAGVHLEAWWPSGSREARRAAGIGGRLGVQFSDLNLDAMLTPRLEALDARVWGLAAPAVEPIAEPAIEPAIEPVGPPIAESVGEAQPEVDARTAAPGLASGRDEPVVLEGEPGVRERLRFLLWARRTRSEDELVIEAPATTPDEPGPA
jgi:hypothetical protein